jgi:Tfp pilus assembly protein PilF
MQLIIIYKYKEQRYPKRKSKKMDRIEKLKEFLKATPDDNFLQHALALEYIKKGEDAAARKIFEELLLKDEDHLGSYYHLARLLERNDEKETAIAWYEKGMSKAKTAGDQHLYNELRSAYEELVF